MLSLAVLSLALAACAALPGAGAFLDLLISQGEVMKLLGLDAELYYVRGGVVNSYAARFTVPVPAHLSDLVFMWRALGAPLPYAMGIEYESRGALLPPQVNISERGLVPTELQTFRVRLPCSGARSAEVLVTLQLNISAPGGAGAGGGGGGGGERRRNLALLFKRNKICLKGVPAEAAGSARNESGLVAGAAGAAGARGAGRAALAAAGCAAAALALLAAAAGARCRRGKPGDSIHTSYTTAAYGSAAGARLKAGPPSLAGSYATIASLHKFPFGSRRSPSPYASSLVSEHVYAAPEPAAYAACSLPRTGQVPGTESPPPAEQLRALGVPRGAVRLGRLAHEAGAAREYRGLLRRGERWEEVIVKTLADSAPPAAAARLVAEGLRLGGLRHAHVLAPAAAAAARRPLLVYCAPEHAGNLKRFLLSCRSGAAPAPGARALAALGAQAACGAAFLHARRLVHADLAARTCLVDAELHLQVCDAALARELFPDDYHSLAEREPRPVKWMAPESLLCGDYSTASDVWSLGVLLWELCALGAAPLAELDAADVAAFLGAGYRPPAPARCPAEMYGLMSWCWSAAPGARPSAPQLLAALDDFQQALATYV